MISNAMLTADYRLVTRADIFTLIGVFCGAAVCCTSLGQNARSLQGVKTLYVGSFGTRQGAEELRHELADALQHGHRFVLATSPEQADVVLTGRGELWVRGFHALSPRARMNSSYAEPLYSGYLSVKAEGKDGDVLWSTFASPPAVSVGDLKHNLASQIVDRLSSDIEGSTGGTTAPAMITAEVTLSGGGATFPLPIYQEWFDRFHSRNQKLQFEYKPVASEAAMTQFAAGSFDFAASDAPPSRVLRPSVEKVNEFPTVAGGVVLIYNLKNFRGDLRLSGTVLADILSGKVRMWNDPSLQALNRGNSLPPRPIVVVRRSDGSGTTFALTDYLSRVSDEWKTRIGAGFKADFPSGLTAVGNEGVADSVGSTPDSLGYVEFIYAFDHRLNFALLQNADGRFVEADLASITAAANTAMGEQLTTSITNAPRADAYPISTFSWLVFRDALQPEKREAMILFLEWVLTSGQRECSSLGYGPLPKSIVERELAILRSLK
jgi:phosphate transport system substrate-binding protein